MIEILHLAISVIALMFLYFAYINKNELAKLISYIILAAILIQNMLSSLAQIAVLDFISSLFNTLGSFVPYIQIALIAYLAFFYMPKNASKLMKRLVIIFSVLVLLIELGIFN